MMKHIHMYICVCVRKPSACVCFSICGPVKLILVSLGESGHTKGPVSPTQ